jgi:uncharacterized protein YqgV (UPF0045/DUF77 family)
MKLELEFTVEPFEPGSPGPHVRAAEKAARAGGATLAIGPFGTLVSGDQEKVYEIVAGVVAAAISAGASRVTLQVTRAGKGRHARPGAKRTAGRSGPKGTGRVFLDTIRPVIEALGAEIVPTEDMAALDVPLAWDGQVVGAMRPPGLHDAFNRLLERVAEELGAPLSELSREGKQRAVQLLEERGAFNFRKSVEDAAQALQVSRFTVYNYLTRISTEKAEPLEPPRHKARR